MRKRVIKGKRQLWCELVNFLDRKSVLMPRSVKNDGSKAWKILHSQFKSFERPRIQQMLTKLMNLKLESNKSIAD